MTSVFIIILAPLLWSIVNHIDKYLLSKATHHSSVSILMVYSTVFSIIVLPFILLLAHGYLFANPEQIVIQIIGGLLLTGSVYLYLVALNKDETSNVIPLALLVPIFSYFFSYTLLGEVLSMRELVACIIILCGALILSLEINEENKIKIKYKTLLAMVVCTAFQAAQETLFKFATIDNSIAVSFFWQHVGILLFGIVLITTSKYAWSDFVSSVRMNGKTMFGVNVTSESLNTAAYMIRSYTTLLAPIAVIATLNGYQPVFVFILGTTLTVFFPRLVKEKIRPIHLLHKGIAIAIIVVGTLMIVQTI